MSRKEELIKYLCKTDEDKMTMEQIIDEFVFLEERLTVLRGLPFIKVHPKNPEIQKATPAAKQYKELLQQYTNILKVISKASRIDENDDESPLRKWVKKHVDNTR